MTVRVPQRILSPEKSLADKSFPASPRRAWKAALDVPEAKVAMSFSVGDLLAGNLKILEKDCATLVLWVILPSGERVRAWWADRDGWKFMSAWLVHPDTAKLTHPEVMTLLKEAA